MKANLSIKAIFRVMVIVVLMYFSSFSYGMGLRQTCSSILGTLGGGFAAKRAQLMYGKDQKKLESKVLIDQTKMHEQLMLSGEAKIFHEGQFSSISEYVWVKWLQDEDFENIYHFIKRYKNIISEQQNILWNRWEVNHPVLYNLPYLALVNGRADVFEYLVEEGFLVPNNRLLAQRFLASPKASPEDLNRIADLRDRSGSTLLSVALEKSDFESLNLILKNTDLGAALSVKMLLDDAYEFPLTYAVKKQNHTLVKWLIGNGIVDDYEQSALRMAHDRYVSVIRLGAPMFDGFEGFTKEWIITQRAKRIFKALSSLTYHMNKKQ